MVADRMNLPSKPAIDRCAGRLQRLLRSLDAADASRDRDNARKAIDAYALEAILLLGHAREEFDRGGKPTQIVRRIRDLDIAKRSAWRPATWKGGERTIRPLFTAEFPPERPTDGLLRDAPRPFYETAPSRRPRSIPRGSRATRAQVPGRV